jgi:hypothetical protein
MMRANPLLGPLEGVGPENQDFFGPSLLCSIQSEKYALKYQLSIKVIIKNKV